MPSAALSSAGKYVLKVTLDNCVNYDTVEVAVKKQPTFTLTSNSPFCEGDTLKLQSQGRTIGNSICLAGAKAIGDNRPLIIQPKATISHSGL
ncbi:MAG: hypothetical protein R2822_00390 [Spirosomataceae bacterium]